MATSAPNTTPDPRPTGDLEHLFRQKFAEAEVTPRAGLWEQLDTELLVEQNNTYRRKLSVHRWVAAACLLLFFSVSGWAVLHQWQRATPGIAGQSAAPTDSRDSRVAANRPSGAVAATTEATAGTASRLPAGSASQGAAEQLVALESTANAAHSFRSQAAASEYGAYAAQLAAAGQGARRPDSRLAPEYQGAGLAAGSLFAGNRYAGTPAGLAATQFGASYSTEAAGMAGWNGLAPRFAHLRAGGLGARPDTLKASLLAVPQPAAGALAATPDDNQPPTKQWRRLRLGGSYAAAAYNPNINFSRNDGRVNADAVTNALRNYYQDDAETEYRRNLRSGLSQRVAVTAAYALGKHWTVVSGVEAAQQRATSATSYGFIDGRQVDRQVADLFTNRASYNFGSATAVAPAATRKTSYRYRTMAIPVEIRYGSVKPGASLYAKVGAAVGLLLGSRSELEGSPEATRVYSLGSADSPYRQVQTSVRGGAGVRYQPAAASWSLALGTTTEIGLTTLNANPSQRLLNQSRPYSVGIEASVEFGNAKTAPLAP